MSAVGDGAHGSLASPGDDLSAEGFEPVANASDVMIGSLVAARMSDGTAICLANHDGEILALHDCCSHQAFPLSAGELHDDGTVECTWHGALFDLHTGEPKKGPACDRVRTFEVRVADGVVHVKVD